MINVNWRPDHRHLRWFAFATLVASGVLGGLALALGGDRALSIGIWVFGGSSFVLGLAAPPAIRPLYIALTAISLPIGWLVSHLILRLIYYGLFAPIGLVFRLTGRDALRRKRPATETYWIERRPNAAPEEYFRQS